MKKNRPTVSILIPNFNQKPAFLSAALQSVFAQTFDNFEVIVSENHSTNGSLEILNSFSDRRLRIVTPDAHLSMPENFAFAAKHARGKYLSFLPSDDLVEPDWLELLVPKISSSDDAVLAFGEVAGVHHERISEIFYFNRGQKLPTKIYSPSEFLPIVVTFNRNVGWVVGGLILADIYFKVGGMAQPGYHLSFDYALLLKLLEHGNIIYVNKLVGRHRVWGTKEGKVDGERSVRAIDDMINLFNQVGRMSVIQRDPRLLAIYRRAKYKKSLLLSLVLLQGKSLQKLSDMDFETSKLKLQNFQNGRVIRLLHSVISSSTVTTLVGQQYGFAKWVYHRIFQRIFQ